MADLNESSSGDELVFWGPITERERMLKKIRGLDVTTSSSSDGCSNLPDSAVDSTEGDSAFRSCLDRRSCNTTMASFYTARYGSSSSSSQGTGSSSSDLRTGSSSSTGDSAKMSDHGSTSVSELAQGSNNFLSALNEEFGDMIQPVERPSFGKGFGDAVGLEEAREPEVLLSALQEEFLLGDSPDSVKMADDEIEKKLTAEVSPSGTSILDLSALLAATLLGDELKNTPEQCNFEDSTLVDEIATLINESVGVPVKQLALPFDGQNIVLESDYDADGRPQSPNHLTVSHIDDSVEEEDDSVDEGISEILDRTFSEKGIGDELNDTVSEMERFLAEGMKADSAEEPQPSPGVSRSSFVDLGSHLDDSIIAGNLDAVPSQSSSLSVSQHSGVPISPNVTLRSANRSRTTPKTPLAEIREDSHSPRWRSPLQKSSGQRPVGLATKFQSTVLQHDPIPIPRRNLNPDFKKPDWKCRTPKKPAPLMEKNPVSKIPLSTNRFQSVVSPVAKYIHESPTYPLYQNVRPHAKVTASTKPLVKVTKSAPLHSEYPTFIRDREVEVEMNPRNVTTHSRNQLNFHSENSKPPDSVRMKVGDDGGEMSFCYSNPHLPPVYCAASGGVVVESFDVDAQPHGKMPHGGSPNLVVKHKGRVRAPLTSADDNPKVGPHPQFTEVSILEVNQAKRTHGKF